MPDSSMPFPGRASVTLGLFSLLYLLLLMYGTLFPLQGWVVPEAGFFRHFLVTEMSTLSATDMVTNVLVFIPAGFLWAGFLAFRIRWSAAVLLASVMGTTLSFSLESLQVFLPARTSALSDLVLNGLGTAIGGGASLILSEHTRPGSGLRNFRNNTFMPGVLANIGLIVVGLWALSQLSPLVPSLGISNLRDGLKPVWYTVTGRSSFIATQSLVYFCSGIALGGVFLSLSHSRRQGLVLFGLILSIVLLMKIPVVSRQLSLEALLGCTAALTVLTLLHRIPDRLLVTCAGYFLLASFVVGALRESGSGANTFAVNWVPFKGHMQNIVGLANILASSWIFLAAGYVARYLSRPSKAVVAAATGAIFILGLASLMEFLQRGIPGRVPDVTDVIIAVVAWGCAWIGATRTA